MRVLLLAVSVRLGHLTGASESPRPGATGEVPRRALVSVAG